MSNNPIELYLPGYKRRSAMEQAMISWCQVELKGRSVSIRSAQERALAEMHRLAEAGVRGMVYISPVKVGGTWVGGSPASYEFSITAKTRAIPSVTISQFVEPEKKP